VIVISFTKKGASRLKDEFVFEEHETYKQLKYERSSKKSIKLEKCFEKFLEQEQLGSDNKWYCSKCKDHQQAYKKFDIWTTPDVLIIHLKRFQYLPSQYLIHRQKIDALVNFPIENLDLTSYMKRCNSTVYAQAPPIYDLYAVSEHSGTLGGGHYTATAQNFQSKNWFRFNDSHVSQTTAEKAISSEAYVLFYRRRKGSLPCGGIQVGSVGGDEEGDSDSMEV